MVVRCRLPSRSRPCLPAGLTRPGFSTAMGDVMTVPGRRIRAIPVGLPQSCPQLSTAPEPAFEDGWRPPIEPIMTTGRTGHHCARLAAGLAFAGALAAPGGCGRTGRPTGLLVPSGWGHGTWTVLDARGNRVHSGALPTGPRGLVVLLSPGSYSVEIFGSPCSTSSLATVSASHVSGLRPSSAAWQ